MAGSVSRWEIGIYYTTIGTERVVSAGISQRFFFYPTQFPTIHFTTFSYELYLSQLGV